MNEFQKLMRVKNILDDPFAGLGLSNDQRIAANMAARGKTLKEIAAITGTSLDTAGGRIKAVSAKLKIKKSEFPAAVMAMIEAALE